MSSNPLEECRQKIDAVDNQVLELFLERMRIASMIAQEKQKENLPILNPARERDILRRVTQQAGEEFGSYARVLFSTLFDLSKSYQRRWVNNGSALIADITRQLENSPADFPDTASVACMGIEGAYAQIAAEKIFKAADIMFFRSFAGVFQAVENGLCECAVLPLENSTSGTVDTVYDLMRDYKFHFVRSCRLQIVHSLLVPVGVALEDIREVFSHPHGLKQCSKYWAKRPDVKLTACESTAHAAELVAKSGQRDVAAIASRECADIYGLQVIPCEMQDSDFNYTRFICISKKPFIYPGANKISLMACLPHKPGSLFRLISKFAAQELNLTKLESRPVPGREFEYRFYFDFDGSVRTPAVLRLLGELEADTDTLFFLGNYSEI
ncbi:MAG: bifunctional chorismate mutase/prephenate dehydratase [Lentisphaerae bacterium]|jgi:chorismate mutase/prephenate dehydratase|nr:bifunctional chorismate mutase/prephenate dehydratase [Lentisphaerota bacterium]